MDGGARVWIRKRDTKARPTYHLRWLDPATGKWRSRRVGTDRKRAEREAAVLEGELDAGTFREIAPVTLSEFTKDHIDKITGTRDAAEADRTLREFATVCHVSSLRRINYTTVEDYVAQLRTKGNATATINKKLRYLRAAFNKAIKRRYLAKNPMDGAGTRRTNTRPAYCSTKKRLASSMRPNRATVSPFGHLST